MKRLRRIGALLLALVMLLSVLPVSASAAEVIDTWTDGLNVIKLYEGYIGDGEYTYLRTNNTGSIAKKVGDAGIYTRLPRNMYYCNINTDYLLMELIPSLYATSVTRTDMISVSDPTVIGNLEYTLEEWSGNDGYAGYPCLAFHYEALKPGTADVEIKFFYNYDDPGASGYGDCGHFHTIPASSEWYAESTTFTVEVTQDYTVHYDGNDPAAADVPADTVETVAAAAADVTVTDSQPALEGHTFLSWNTKADGTGDGYAAGDKVSMSYPDSTQITLYAQWEQTNAPAPTAPSTDSELDAIVGDDFVTVDCTNTKNSCANGHYGLVAAGCTIGSVTETDGVYTVAVTVDADYYCGLYGSSHTLVSGETDEVVTLTWNGTAWTADKTGVIIEVTCPDPVPQPDPAPAKPAAGDVEALLGDDFVTVDCTNTKNSCASGHYGLVAAGCTIGSVTETDGVYTVAVTVDADYYCGLYGSSHTLVSGETDEVVTLTWNGTAWTADKTGVIIEVTCPDPVPQPDPAPAKPAAGDVEALLGDDFVTVDCTNTKNSCASGHYDLVAAGCTIGSVTETDGVYTVAVTVDADYYCGLYGSSHTLVSGETDEVVTLTWNGTAWTADKTGVTFEVTCPDAVVPTDNATYRVEHYLEKLNGKYELDHVDEEVGKIGDTVEVAVRKYKHFHLNKRASDLSGTVVENKDGKELVLKIYYDRNVYTVTYTDGVKGETIFKDQVYHVRYGEDTPQYDGKLSEKYGYRFAGWSPKLSKTVDGDVTYTAKWKDYPWWWDFDDENETPLLNTWDHKAYIKGYGDGTVQPEQDITRAEVAMIFYRLLTDDALMAFETSYNSYTDVHAGDWYNVAISTLSNAGILKGYGGGKFNPDAPISRAEFAAIAARFSDVVYVGDNSFCDVPYSHWAFHEITMAEYLGWVDGYAGDYFCPDKNISRAETVTLVNRVLERAVKSGDMLKGMKTWIDNKPGAWYYEAMQEATNGHTYGRTDKLVSGQDFCYEYWISLR